MRAAIYYAPPADAPLTRLAADWLGRHAYGAGTSRAPDPELDPVVAEPARYGFHATMKAPFRLSEGKTLEELDVALAAFCEIERATRIGELVLSRLDGFMALVPGGPEPGLLALAGRCVEQFEPFRAPLGENEMKRRRPERLGEAQRAHLERWGYPYVFDEFRFHMTLTGRLAPEAAEPVAARLAVHFAPVLHRPLAVDGLALFVEDEPGAPFRVHSRYTLKAVHDGRNESA